jgi:hypothetical protein
MAVTAGTGADGGAAWGARPVLAAGAGVLATGALGAEAAAGAVGVLVLADTTVPLALACPDGAGGLVGCDPPVAPWAALPAATVEEATDDTAEEAEEADDAAGDTTSPTACAGAEACDDPPLPTTPRGAVPEAETTGFCEAAAGRAKITVRIKPSMKVTARPPQAYKHARRVQAPTFASPTHERMGTFPSTARKPRQALRDPAMTPELVTRR